MSDVLLEAPMTRSARSFLVRHPATLAGAVVLALGSVAGAWMPLAPEHFTLPPGQAKPQPLWQGPKTRRVAVKVRVNAGKAEVQQPAGTPIAELPVGSVCIWEGNFDGFNVENVESIPCVLFTQVVEEQGPSAFVGAGQQDFPLAGGARYTEVYRSDQPRTRLLYVAPSTAPLTVLSGTDLLLSLEAGDAGLALHTGNSLRMRGGAQQANHEFWIWDPLPELQPDGGWPVRARYHAQPGDVGDALHLDGTANVRVTLTNLPASPGDVTITSSVPCTPSQTVQPGGSATASGPLTEFRWVCMQPNTWVEIAIEPVP
jgi:hypothetical protein